MSKDDFQRFCVTLKGQEYDVALAADGAVQRITTRIAGGTNCHGREYPAVVRRIYPNGRGKPPGPLVQAAIDAARAMQAAEGSQ
jgi:hypothetical protein